MASDPTRDYIDEQIKQLRCELLNARKESLDHRFRTVDWWLGSMAAAFTLAAVVLALLTYFNTQASQQLREETQQLRDETEEVIQRLSKDEAELVGDIVAGAFTQVPIESFIPVIVASGQVTRKEITQFVEAAHNILAGQDWQEQIAKGFDPSEPNTWPITVNNIGTMSVHGYRTESEITAAFNGLAGLLGALRSNSNLPDGTILVRGMKRRYFVVRGIPGLTSRIGISLELYETE